MMFLLHSRLLRSQVLFTVGYNPKILWFTFHYILLSTDLLLLLLRLPLR